MALSCLSLNEYIFTLMSVFSLRHSKPKSECFIPVCLRRRRVASAGDSNGNRLKSKWNMWHVSSAVVRRVILITLIESSTDAV